jgi:hypothetical protein
MAIEKKDNAPEIQRPESQPEKKEKQPPKRSPAYPFVSLREAVKRAEELYAKEELHPAPTTLVVQHWKYSAKSSGGKQTLAALRSFGLLEGTGTVRISDSAYRIVKNAPDRDQLLRRAALAPPIHTKMWEKYGSKLPSEENLKWALIDEGFNENSVKDFLREYRDTIEFAKLGSSDTLPPAGKDKRETPAGENLMQPAFDAAGKQSLSPGGGPEPLTFPLLNGNVVELRVRQRIAPEEVEDLKLMFEIWLRKIVQRNQPSEPKAEN